jgi:hypothetical protein
MTPAERFTAALAIIASVAALVLASSVLFGWPPL